MYINVVANSVMLQEYLRHDFYNVNCIETQSENPLQQEVLAGHLNIEVHSRHTDMEFQNGL